MPAKVEMLPVALFTMRTMKLAYSTMYRLSYWSMAMSCGQLTVAAVARPPLPVEVQAREAPTTVETTPSLTLRTPHAALNCEK